MNKPLTVTLLFLLGTALVSCSMTTPTSIISGDEDSVTLNVSAGLFTADTEGAKRLASQHCARYEKEAYHGYSDTISVAGGLSYYIHVTFLCMDDEQLVAYANEFRRTGKLPRVPPQISKTTTPVIKQSISSQDQCKAFGFTDDTPEMANCLLEIYKIANQPQQNTVITNSSPARINSSDTTSGIELMNRGLQILNGVGTPSAPISRTSTCTRIGDISGQVVTFNSITCPAGYAPTF